MEVVLEPGLYRTGPRPIHVHHGKPTPWSEGCVFKVIPDDAKPWIVNAQPGFGYATSSGIWEEAQAVFIIASGAVYFINSNDVNDWSFFSELGIECQIVPNKTIALVSTYTEVIAVGLNRQKIWSRVVAIDGVEILKIEEGLIHGMACHDPPKVWEPFTLRLEDGTVVE